MTKDSKGLTPAAAKAAHALNLATVDQARRTFLTRTVPSATAAAALSASTATALGSPAGEATPNADPIFELIARHRGLRNQLLPLLHNQSRLQDLISSDKRQTCLTMWDDENLVELDDPQWIESERAIIQNHQASSAVEDAIIDTGPTTVGGAAAVLAYMVEVIRRGDTFGGGYVDDDAPSGFVREHGLDFEVMLCASVSKSLAAIQSNAVPIAGGAI